MNAIEQAQKAYGPAQHHIRTPRSIEVQLFNDITARLKRTDQSFAALADAIQDNRRLWTTLAIDVADSQNTLPQQLRAQIFYLAEFVTHHSSKVLQRKADASALVDVNMAVLRGLNGNRGAQ